MSKNVAVVHTKFTTKGGAEVVCMNVLEALQDEYDLTLYSLDEPDFEALNTFCGTDVRDVRVRAPRYVTPAVNRSIAALNGVTGGKLGPQLPLKSAVLNRLVRRHAPGFDLTVSTSDEFALRAPSVQYVHFPRFNHAKQAGWSASDRSFATLYDRFCSALAGVSRASVRTSTLLTNSSWTADVIEDVYGVVPNVVHPPVSTDEFDGRPWNERESGFVALGRIAPDKNVVELIDIVRRIRERGHDVHLHLVGPTAEHNEFYGRRVERAARRHDFVAVEGELDRKELVSLVCSHRYGIHGKRNEHFGMTVAEMVAGGAIPFVPDGGGQVDIVNRREELRYRETEEAVTKIDRVLGDPALQERLRADLADVRDRFSREAFQTAIREEVNDALGNAR